MRRLAADVLVLGAGLAGLRAALSCLEANPAASVLVASLSDAPAGSSFANANDALGMHVCMTEAQGQDYLADVRRLAAGAFVDPGLAAVQAREGRDRLEDLVELGLHFLRDEAGNLAPHGSCFAPDSRRAYVFRNLAQAYHAFRGRLTDLGCRFTPGFSPASILRDPARPGSPAVGAVLAPDGPGEPLAVAAKAVIAALGGSGSLFANAMTGPGVPGASHGLLAQAGARLANAGYLQFMWGALPERTFWTPAALGDGEYTALPTDGREIPLRDIIADAAALAAQRRGHCPFGYAMADNAMDLGLAGFLDHSGQVIVRGPDGRRLRLAPMAQATNGGAVIDSQAETTVPGLLACGECATGMHGANRLGGAMVLATQVFGHRAGLRAGQLARELAEPDDRRFGRLAGDCLGRMAMDEGERTDGLADLRGNLSRLAVLGGRPGSKEYLARLGRERPATRDWRLALCRDTALAILEGLPAAS
jgi:L-aspartate oxidase